MFCSKLLSFFSSFFCSKVSGQPVNKALENSTNLWLYDLFPFSILYSWIGSKFRIHKHILCIWTVDTIVLRKFGHAQVSQKVRGNIDADTGQYFL